MSKSRQKGTYAENGVRDFMNLWYPGWEEQGEGEPWSRTPSKGAKDEGDVHGPFTAIEVKNYANPALSGLLDNASGKGVQAGLKYWFLVYKQAGFSAARAGHWNGMVTLDCLLSNFGVRPNSLLDASVEEVLAQVPDLCATNQAVDGHFLSPAPRREFPERPWTPFLIFSDIMSSVPRRRLALLDYHNVSAFDTDERIIPFVIHPRRDPDGMRPVGEWYVFTHFIGFARMLETLGVLPQDPADYEESEAVAS